MLAEIQNSVRKTITYITNRNDYLFWLSRLLSASDDWTCAGAQWDRWVRWTIVDDGGGVGTRHGQRGTGSAGQSIWCLIHFWNYNMKLIITQLIKNLAIKILVILHLNYRVVSIITLRNKCKSCWRIIRSPVLNLKSYFTTNLLAHSIII